MYFIVPLLLGGSDTEGKPRRRAVAVEPAPVAPLAAATPSASQPTDREWRTVTALRLADPFMASVSTIPGDRNPFRFPGTAAPLVASEDGQRGEQSTAPDRSESIDPGQFILTATVYGSSIRLATINGRTYREQQFLRSSDDASDLLPWIVSRVGPNFVILELDGREHMVRLQSEPRAGGISITSGGL
jgi:hypothetical protein